MSAPDEIITARWHLTRGYGYLAALWLVLPILGMIPGGALTAAARSGQPLGGGTGIQATLGITLALAIAAGLGALALAEAYAVECAAPVHGGRVRPLGLLGAPAALLLVVLAVGWLPALAGVGIGQATADRGGLAVIGILGLCAVVIGTVTAAAWQLERAVRYGTADD